MGNPHPQLHTDLDGEPWGTKLELTSICTPRHCRSLYSANPLPSQHLAHLSLAYLIKKMPQSELRDCTLLCVSAYETVARPRGCMGSGTSASSDRVASIIPNGGIIAQATVSISNTLLDDRGRKRT